MEIDIDRSFEPTYDPHDEESNYVKGLNDYLAGAKRRKKLIILVFSIIFAIAAALALFLPSIYRSSATISIEQQSIPEHFVSSALTSYANQRIQLISQRVLTTESLQRIVDKYNLYADELKSKTPYVVIRQMRKDIEIEMEVANIIDPRSGGSQKATIAFNLAYENESANLAQKVTEEILTLFMEANTKRRKEVSSQTTSFLAMERDRLGQQLSSYEAALSSFKSEHADTLPELLPLNKDLVERTEERLDRIGLEIKQLVDQKKYLRLQLNKTPPQIVVYTGKTSKGGESANVYDGISRLQILKSDYMAKSAKYSSIHPDVVSLREEIVNLEKLMDGSKSLVEKQQRLKQYEKQLTDLRKNRPDTDPDMISLRSKIADLEQEIDRQVIGFDIGFIQNPGQPDNPKYINLLEQIEQNKSELAAAENKRKLLEDELVVYQHRVRQAPEVEQKYAELTRDYENSVKKYKELKAKELEADLSRSLEESDKSERLAVLEPPRVPTKPVKPKRLLIVIAGLILGLGGGIGLVVVLEFLDTTIRGVPALRAVTGAPPLMVIPMIDMKPKSSEFKSGRVLAYGGLGILAMGLLAGIHSFVMPIDTAWAAVLRWLSMAKT